MFKSLRAVEALSGNLQDLSSDNLTEVLLDCYIPITQGQYGILAQNDSEFFVTPDNMIFTYATMDSHFVIMPLVEKYAEEVRSMQA